MATEDQIRSLTRREIQVLYWRCKGDLNKEIALRYQKDIKAIEASMTSVYQKLGVDKKANKVDRLAYLTNEICPIVMRLIGENEDNLERWPLYGVRASVQNRGITVYAEKETDDSPKEPDPIVRDLMLIDQGEVVDEPPAFQTSKPALGEKTSSTGRTQTTRFAVLGVLGLFCLCITIGGFIARNSIMGLLSSAASPTSTASITSPSITEIISTATATRIVAQPPTYTPEPTLTFTPEVLPTAAPFPGMESFSKPLSDLWKVSGDPYIATGTIVAGPQFDKSLTAKAGDVVSISTGNRGWVDYVINLQVNQGITNMEMIIGVRVQDLNNMVMLKCIYSSCSWIVLSGGRENVLLENQLLDFQYSGGTIRVEGNDFIASSDPSPKEVAISLPEKYKEKFKNGGVFIKFHDTEFNYLEVQPK